MLKDYGWDSLFEFFPVQVAGEALDVGDIDVIFCEGDVLVEKDYTRFVVFGVEAFDFVVEDLKDQEHEVTPIQIQIYRF